MAPFLAVTVTTLTLLLEIQGPDSYAHDFLCFWANSAAQCVRSTFACIHLVCLIFQVSSSALLPHHFHHSVIFPKFANCVFAVQASMLVVEDALMFFNLTFLSNSFFQGRQTRCQIFRSRFDDFLPVYLCYRSPLQHSHVQQIHHQRHANLQCALHLLSLPLQVLIQAVFQARLMEKMHLHGQLLGYYTI